jgi:hypothetical protein
MPSPEHSNWFLAIDSAKVMQALASIAAMAKEVLSKAERMTSTGNQDQEHQSVLPLHNIPSINCTASTGKGQ